MGKQDEEQSSRSNTSADVHPSVSSDHNRQMASEIPIKGVSILDSESRFSSYNFTLYYFYSRMILYSSFRIADNAWKF